MAHMGANHASMNHEGMDHGGMKHGSMDHGNMDHGSMDHDVGASTSDACSNMGMHGMSVGISRFVSATCPGAANNAVCLPR